MLNGITRPQWVNLFWPGNNIWQHGTGSTLAQVIVLAWWRQAITWPNVDLWLVRSSNIHLIVISQEIPQSPITTTNLKITYLEFHADLPGDNELIQQNSKGHCYARCALNYISFFLTYHNMLEHKDVTVIMKLINLYTIFSHKIIRTINCFN